jgi:hypothetical protein
MSRFETQSFESASIAIRHNLMQSRKSQALLGKYGKELEKKRGTWGFSLGGPGRSERERD